jgi:molybdopterin converting factor small subunit
VKIFARHIRLAGGSEQTLSRRGATVQRIEARLIVLLREMTLLARRDNCRTTANTLQLTVAGRMSAVRSNDP